MRYFWRLCCLISVLCLGLPVYAAPTHWLTLAPGLDYTRITPSAQLPSYLHAFRIDLRHYRLELAFSEDYKNNINTVADLVKAHQAIVGVNGGFFSPEFKPLGLRVNQGTQHSPLRNISWWGIFFIKNKQPYITTQNDYHPDSNIKFAVQSGPRLIIDGKIPSLKPGAANRTALGITKTGDVILLATENLPLTTLQLAQIMQAPTSEGGLNCINALNLDGGSSTQLYASIDNFQLDVPGYSTIADAVLIKPR
jgi:uncharacterized protein YigE (DUF2233 family)